MQETNGKKYCVIHGHFYQPPREDPWLGEIERQSSAAPFHDWNERIFDECYRPNSFSRILDERGEIVAVSNNYSFMSFNFGPTLFSWLAKYHPTVYGRIVDADRRSCEKYDGHGAAVAQVYNHIIMPHASRRDKLTQIRWSKSFFERHFNRAPEGMWLAETAINRETVECLVQEGITFVVLSPNQAEAFRFMGSKEHWIHTDEVGLDPRFPYRTYVDDANPARGHLDVFFFDEPLSRGISFEDMLDNADRLTHRINGCYSPELFENELVNLATDGETFGHHKKNSDMCLAYFFNVDAEKAGIEITNYAYYLSQNPPRREVRLKNNDSEGSAWSCAHGTGRWIRDCGCNTGGLPGWNQRWRGPLRDAMNGLQRAIDEVFVREFVNYFDNPYLVRDAYEPHFGDYAGAVSFLQATQDRPIPDAKLTRLVNLLEAQRYMLYGFTSCAWFFNDIAGIETVQNIRYAFRAWQLTWPHCDTNVVLEEFINTLDAAISNNYGVTGKTLFYSYAYPMLNHLQRAAFTAAVSSYIYGDAGEYLFSAYKVHLTRGEKFEVLEKEWLLFDATIVHEETQEGATLTLALQSTNGLQIDGAILPIEGCRHILDAKLLSSLLKKATLRLSMSDIFGSYREVITDRFVDAFVADTMVDYLGWAGVHNSRLGAITQINGGLPQALAGTVAFFLGKEWDMHAIQMVKSPHVMESVSESLREVIHKAERYGITLDKSETAQLFTNSIKEDIRSLDGFAISVETLERINLKIATVKEFSIPVQFAMLQDTFYLFYKQIFQGVYPEWVSEGRSENSEQYKQLVAVNKVAQAMGYNIARTAL